MTAPQPVEVANSNVLATEPPVAKRRAKRLSNSATAYLFLAPAMVLFAVFAYFPLYRLAYFSAHVPNRNQFIDREDQFVGWGNVFSVIFSSEFLDALWVSIRFMAIVVPFGLILGTCLAVTADRKLKGVRIFQTIFSSTVASSVAVAAVVFLTLLQPESGILKDVEWLSLNKPGSAILAISLSAVWQNAGLTFVIVLAALQAVPEELKEASLLDGYGPVRRFFKITVPLISPSLLFLAIVLVVTAIQAYAQFEILQPVRSAQPLLYKIADPSGVTDISTRASMSIGLFVITLVVSIVQFTFLDKRVHYGD